MTFQINGRSAALVLAFVAGVHVGMPALTQARPVEKFEPAESLEGNYLAAVVAGSARDLGAASIYLREAIKNDPQNSELLERGFVAFLADGAIN